MVLALVLAGTAAGGVYLYAGSVQREAAQQRQVELASATPAPTLAPAVVARADVKAHTALTADAFEVKQLPREAVAPNAVVSLDSLAGKVLDAPITAGEQLTSNRLIDAQADDPATFADIIPPGLRAMSLTFTELGGAAGLIVPGNHVDVVAVFKKDTLGKDESMIMLQDVQVLAVAQATSADQLPAQGSPAASAPPATNTAAGTKNAPLGAPQPSAANTAGSTSTTRSGPPPAPVAAPSATPAAGRLPVAPPQARTVTVAVAPEAAQRLALAEEYGHLRYIVRPTGERSQQSLLPADLGTLTSPLEAASAQIIATEISPTNVKVGDTLTVKITVKNTSDKPLQTMGPAPGFTYVQGQTYYSQQFAAQPGKFRVAVGTAGLDMTELPYRWGLGGDLAPGATTTVTGQIKLTSDFKPTNFWAAIVEEPARVVQTGVGMTLVTSMPENVAVVAVDAANARSGPSIASSVIDQIAYGTELEIVGQNADWFKVKLPDQRLAWVAAGWIVTPGR
jgi:pilus assembly protein CpaB